MLDGEIVVLRNGRPDFDAISGRIAARRLADWAARTSPATFVAFDMLELDGRSLAEQPYSRRREALEALGFDALRWALTPSYGEGEAVWAATGDLGLEGIVAKDPRSPWVARRSRRWLKCKHWRHATFAVMGWAPSTGAGAGGHRGGGAGAIGELRVAGVAPLHVDHGTREAVMDMPGALRTDRMPLNAPLRLKDLVPCDGPFGRGLRRATRG